MSRRIDLAKLGPAARRQVDAFLFADAEHKRQRKYRNQPIVVDGERFDSKAEAAQWGKLRMQLLTGEIAGLRRQVPFPIEVNGRKICDYVADFTFLRDGKLIVQDVKGVRTPVYRLKAKLLAACCGIEIEEVT